MDHATMLRTVSRTFALSIERLPGVLGDAVAISYLLLRISDCIEDHPELEAHRKSELLRLWAQILDGRAPAQHLVGAIQHLDGNDPEVAVAQNAGSVLSGLHGLPSAVQQAITPRVARTSRGMARWQDHGPYVADEAELDDYMHEVAGRVGYLLTDVFAWHSPHIAERRSALMPLSREYGLALQTVNVIRGLRDDYERGWVFVPESFYAAVGLSREDLFDPRHLDAALDVVSLLADKAARHLRHGMTYVQAFPRRQHQIRLACMWPLFFAVRTLAISRNNTAVLRSEAKMGRDEVKRIIRDTTMFGWSNRWLERYYLQLAEAPAMAATLA